MFTDTFDIGVTFRSMVSVVPANTSDANPTTIANPNIIAIFFISYHLLLPSYRHPSFQISLP
jgi:hypothetical protein